MPPPLPDADSLGQPAVLPPSAGPAAASLAKPSLNGPSLAASASAAREITAAPPVEAPPLSPPVVAPPIEHRPLVWWPSMGRVTRNLGGLLFNPRFELKARAAGFSLSMALHAALFLALSLIYFELPLRDASDFARFEATIDNVLPSLEPGDNGAESVSFTAAGLPAQKPKSVPAGDRRQPAPLAGADDMSPPPEPLPDAERAAQTLAAASEPPLAPSPRDTVAPPAAQSSLERSQSRPLSASSTDLLAMRSAAIATPLAPRRQPRLPIRPTPTRRSWCRRPRADSKDAIGPGAAKCWAAMVAA